MLSVVKFCSPSFLHILDTWTENLSAESTKFYRDSKKPLSVHNVMNLELLFSVWLGILG